MSQNQPENLDAKVPKRAALVASLCAVSLACVKFAVGLFSGSVAVLSSALDSLMDFVISVLNFFALKKSSQKRNEEYNFGFDKIEALMGLLEALFIGGMAVFIFFESVRKLYAQEGVQKPATKRLSYGLGDGRDGVFDALFKPRCQKKPLAHPAS